MASIKKSLLFTIYIVDNKITCIRCNLTGKFVKHGIYFAIENQTTLNNGIICDSIIYDSITCDSITYDSITNFTAVSLFDYINVLNVLSLALFSVLSVSLINLFL